MAGRVPAVLGTAPPPAPPACGTATLGSAAPPPFRAPPTKALNTVLATHGIPGSTMGLGVFFILGLLVLGAELGPTPETGGQPQKPGRCPRDFTRCLRLQPPLCANDSSCPGWHKCCPRDCRLRCIPPAEEKPGACPAAAPEGLFVPCSFPCLEDKDCVGAQKCCPLSCGPACLEPVWAEDTPTTPGWPRGPSKPPASATSTPTRAPTAVTHRVPDSSAGSPSTEGRRRVCAGREEETGTPGVAGRGVPKPGARSAPSEQPKRRGCPRLRRGRAGSGAEAIATAPPRRSAATEAAGAGACRCPRPEPLRPRQRGRRGRGAGVTETAATGRCAATGGVRSCASPSAKQSLGSARPAPGCSPATTADPGAGTTPSAPASRSAA
ncbi:uncharacterized protein [Heliangelus exortis]|uniref:uncharacterized protein isoform X5 n=1 Tax=Heliangelus exortis TaxID=472823 RepID=UPI003A90523F